MSVFLEAKTTMNEVPTVLSAHKSSLRSFEYLLPKASLNPAVIKDFEVLLELELPFPLKVQNIDDSFLFNCLTFGTDSAEDQSKSIVKSIKNFYLPAKTEVLNTLSNQILEGIKKIGFQNTKSQKDKNKHMFLYAINDHCNDCGREWETFPLVLTVKENLLDFRIIFAVDCKPGQFIQKKEPSNEDKIKDSNRNPKPELLDQKDQNASKSIKSNKDLDQKIGNSSIRDQASSQQSKLKNSLESNELRLFNLQDQIGKRSLNFKNYLELDSDEFMLKSSRFLSEFELVKEHNSKNNLGVLFEFLQYTKKFIGNWRFIYDNSKMQVILRHSMKPLYPFHFNLPIPQEVTSEAVIYYTAFAYGIYEIYIKKGNYGENFLKPLKKICKRRSKKPIIVFSLLNSKDDKLIIENQQFNGEWNKAEEILNIMKEDKNTSKIFLFSKIKKNDKEIILPRIKNVNRFKIFDLQNPCIRVKTKKKYFKMINYFSKTNYHIGLEEAKNFFTKSGKLYFNYTKSFLSLFTKIDHKDSRNQAQLETLQGFLENILVLKSKSDEMMISEKDIDYDKENGRVLNGTKIKIIDFKTFFEISAIQTETLNIRNEALKKYVMNRCFFEGFTRRYFGILDTHDGQVIVEKILNHKKVLIEEDAENLVKPLKKLSKGVMEVIDKFQSYNNSEIQISIRKIFIYDKTNLKMNFDLIVEIEYEAEFLTLMKNKQVNLSTLKLKYANVPKFILRFLMILAYKLTGKYALNIKFTKEEIARVIYLEHNQEILFRLPKNRFLTDFKKINLRGRILK